MCNIKMLDSPLCVSPQGFPSSPVTLADQAIAAGMEDPLAVKQDDEFFMHIFKVAPCAKRTMHEWNTCCYAHAGEKAARRDPRQYTYNSVACPEMLQSGKCPRGDACDMAHSVFEHWLHPQRYRTTLCRDGAACDRSVCFFAHSEAQLRPLTAPADSGTDPLTTKGKFSLSALPASVQRRRAQEKTARQSPQARGLARQQSGCNSILQQQQQQRVPTVGNPYCSRSSSGSLDSLMMLMAHAGLGNMNNTNSSSCLSSPIMPMPILLPGSTNLAAAAAGGQPGGVNQLNELIIAYQAHAITSDQHRAAAIAAAAAEEANNQLNALWASFGMSGDTGCLPAALDGCASTRYANTACSSPNALLGVSAAQLQGSPIGLASSPRLPQGYGYSPAATSLALQPPQQQQGLLSCSSLGAAAGLAGMPSADALLLQQLSPAVSGPVQQPVLMTALSADPAFLSICGMPQVSPRVSGGCMQLAGQAAGLAW